PDTPPSGHLPGVGPGRRPVLPWEGRGAPWRRPMRTRTEVFFGGALLGALLLAGCGDPPGVPTMKNSPEEMFEGVIVSPLPEDVSHVEGVGDMADTYYVWLRFRATNRFIDALIASGYRPAEWPEVELRVRL